MQKLEVHDSSDQPDPRVYVNVRFRNAEYW